MYWFPTVFSIYLMFSIFFYRRTFRLQTDAKYGNSALIEDERTRSIEKVRTIITNSEQNDIAKAVIFSMSDLIRIATIYERRFYYVWLSSSSTLLCGVNCTHILSGKLYVFIYIFLIYDQLKFRSRTLY